MEDLARLVKRLPPDKLAQYEPVTGVTLVNMSKSAFFDMSRRMQTKGIDAASATVLRAINHETGHFIQSCMTGYMFRRNSWLLSVFNSRRNGRIFKRLMRHERRAKRTLWVIEKLLGKKRPLAGRLANMVIFTFQTRRAALLAQSAPDGHHSMARALTPHFFAERDALIARETQPNLDGVSTLGVIEGGAVAYAALMEPASRTPEAFITRMQADLKTLPPLYHELWNFVYPQADLRSREIFLPLCALALCYERPAMALPFLLRFLLNIPQDEVAQQAAAAFNALPSCPEAGMRLGKAEAQVSWRRKPRLYGPFFARFRDDPAQLTPFTLLTQPQSLETMEHLPLCLTFSDGYQPANMPSDEIAARMVLAHHILEVDSLVRDQRQYQHSALEFARRALSRL
jgi:hypothetical protein